MQCRAKSKRSQKRCLKWAVRGRTTCHMHGGTSIGPKTKLGKERSRQAVLKHGDYTKESMELNRESMALIHRSKNLIVSLSEFKSSDG